MHVLKQSNEKSFFIEQKIPNFQLRKNKKLISNSISFKGVGLHTGNKVSMTLHPAPVDTGIIFRIIKNKKKK